MTTTTRTSLAQSTKMSDEKLVIAARTGNQQAFAELWRRHARSGLRVAAQFTSRIEPEDLVSEAYTRIYKAVAGGGGPTGAFRPYLYTTIRNIASRSGSTPQDINVDDIDDLTDPNADNDPHAAQLDRSLTVTAFRSLPERWQSVLWYTEIEGMDPQEVAPILDLSPNGVAALSYRAREGLRTAWLQAHISNATATGEHQWAITRLGDYARDGLSARETQRVSAHLAACADCSAIHDEVHHVSLNLAFVMLPLLLGGVVGGALLASIHGAAAGAATAAAAYVAGSAAGAAAGTISGGIGHGFASVAVGPFAAMPITVPIAVPAAAASISFTPLLATVAVALAITGGAAAVVSAGDVSSSPPAAATVATVAQALLPINTDAGAINSGTTTPQQGAASADHQVSGQALDTRLVAGPVDASLTPHTPSTYLLPLASALPAYLLTTATGLTAGLVTDVTGLAAGITTGLATALNPVLNPILDPALHGAPAIAPAPPAGSTPGSTAPGSTVQGSTAPGSTAHGPATGSPAPGSATGTAGVGPGAAPASGVVPAPLAPLLLVPLTRIVRFATSTVQPAGSVSTVR